jgi:hypothetical protein
MAIAIAFVDSNLDRAWAGARGPRWTSAITSLSHRRSGHFADASVTGSGTRDADAVVSFVAVRRRGPPMRASAESERGPWSGWSASASRLRAGVPLRCRVRWD